MAKRKIDEQVSYNWLFFLFASGFALVTFWAVYDEVVTRREYKTYQEAFFDVEASLAKAKVDAAKAALDANEERKQLEAERAAIEAKLADPEMKKRITEVDAKLQAATDAAFDATQNHTFSKSELDEAYYYYTVAKHDDPSRTSATYKDREKVYRDLVARTDADAEKMRDAEARKKAVETELAELKQAERLEEITKKVETLERPYAEAVRAHEAAVKKVKGSLIAGKATEVIQQNLEDIGKVDRCESCHLGSARGGFEPDKVSEVVFQSHPVRRTLLGIHPPEKFGCTTCHDGQGRATTKFYAHAPGPDEDSHAYHIHYWETPLLKGPPGGNGKEYMQAKCRGCHEGEWDLRSELTCEIDSECPLDASGRPMVCEVPTPAWSPDAPHGSVQEAEHAAALAAAVKEGKAKPPEPVKYCLAAEASVKLKDPAKPDAGGLDAAKPEDRKRIVRRSDVAYVNLAPTLSKGLKVIEEVGCYGCHPIEGYLSKTKPAPDLTRIFSKLSDNQAWMVDWIKDPKAFRPHTRMPRFWPELHDPESYPYPLDQEELAALTKQQQVESEAMAAFLLAKSKASTKYTFALEEIPAAVASQAEAPRGAYLVATLGCIACHNVEIPASYKTAYKAKYGIDIPEAKLDHKNRATEFDHGPDLANVGAKTSKQWIYSWVRDPRKFSPTTRMPDLRLTPQEAADIAEFLSQQTEGKTYAAKTLPLDDKATIEYGEKLVKNYGCFGCHLVEGFEETPGIGAELSEFGVKTTDRLDFGDYITDHNQQTWDAWTWNKLQHPRVYAYDLKPWRQGEPRDGRAVMRMPQFDLTPDEIRAVMVVLKGMRGRDEKELQVLSRRMTEVDRVRERGRELVRYYNCYGCHRVDGFEGDVGQLERYSIRQGNGKFGPPELTGEGYKTQPEWLFRFLKRPFLMRPLPKMRMPTFGLTDAESTDLVAMFAALDRVEYPFRFYADVGPPSEIDRAVGEELFRSSKCQQCHIVGEVGAGPLPETVVAPSLLMSKDRLRAEWVNRWLASPGALQENTAMPTFWNPDNPLESLLASPEGQALATRFPASDLDQYRKSRERQIEAVKNYLFVLQPPGTPTAAAAAPGRPTAAAPTGTQLR